MKRKSSTCMHYLKQSEKSSEKENHRNAVELHFGADLREKAQKQVIKLFLIINYN